MTTWWLYSSTWVLLSRNEQIINSPAIRDAASTVNTNGTKVPALDGRLRQPVSNPALKAPTRLSAFAKIPQARCPGEFNWPRR